MPATNNKRRDVPPLKAAFMRARRAETQFAIRLRKIASHIGDIVRGFDPESSDGLDNMRAALSQYDPWPRFRRSFYQRPHAPKALSVAPKQTWREVRQEPHSSR